MPEHHIFPQVGFNDLVLADDKSDGVVYDNIKPIRSTKGDCSFNLEISRNFALSQREAGLP